MFWGHVKLQGTVLVIVAILAGTAVCVAPSFAQVVAPRSARNAAPARSQYSDSPRHPQMNEASQDASAPQEGPATSAVRPWDVVKEKSTFEVQLGKSGLLRIFGDEHFIDVTGYEFKIAFDPQAPAQGSSVEIVIPSRGLRVRDPHLSAETRLEVQAKMEGPEVLDIANFREIRFKSKRVTAGDPGLYRVTGDLTIRASSRPLAFDLTLEREGDGYRAHGVAPVKMTAFGIEPPSAGGGGIKVRDEMKIVFDLRLVPQT